MPFITFPERYGREQGEITGRIKGLLVGLRSLLRVRFAAEGEALMPAIEKIEDPEELADLLAAVEKAAGIDAVRALLATPPGATAT